MNKIPKPTDSGSSGTQETSKELIIQDRLSPMEGLPIAQTLQGLAATRSRSMGGEVAAGLLAGSFQQISHDLTETKRELKNTRSQLDQTKDSLSEWKQRAAVLKERVRSSSRNRHLKYLSITVGTALISIAIEFARNNQGKYSLILGPVGVLLLFYSWLSTESEDAT